MTPDLQLLLDDIWRGLCRAAADRRHGWRTPVLATIGADGAPRARTVVLRAVDRQVRTLRLHTDRRSAKAGEIACDPRVALVFWDARARLQLRAGGIAELLTGGAARDAAWAATPPGARRDYATLDAPGTPSPAAQAAYGGDGSANFALVLVRIVTIDWLSLARDGHRRAGFALEEDGPRATWLVP
ncbi:MAG: pyridoxamine 5'-phosphate oxidase family protein [Acetobacteraceae bacterium]